MLWLIDVYAILVMYGQQLLAYHSNDFAILIVKRKIETKNVSPELPAKAFDVSDVLYEMKKLIRQFEASSISHGYEMALMQRQYLSLDMCHMCPGGVSYICLVMDRRKL